MEPARLKALIIDDEPLAHKIILNFAKDVKDLEIVGQCYLATEALDFLHQQEVDLLFLDIQMPKLRGLDFLRLLDQKPLVIITSAHQEFALEGFELDVCDYLLKPFRFDRFLKAVRKAKSLYQSQGKSPTPPTAESTQNPSQQLFIKSDKRHIQLHIADIHYLEGQGNYVKVWLAKRFHLTARTLQSFADQLPTNRFIRIHKSFIVNKSQIHYLEGNRLVMRNGSVLQVGRSYRDRLRQIVE
ncbi:MAG: LytTR family DNA-binding domain-containing protein [Bacteroidota bacterium]